MVFKKEINEKSKLFRLVYENSNSSFKEIVDKRLKHFTIGKINSNHKINTTYFSIKASPYSKNTEYNNSRFIFNYYNINNNSTNWFPYINDKHINLINLAFTIWYGNTIKSLIKIKNKLLKGKSYEFKNNISNITLKLTYDKNNYLKLNLIISKKILEIFKSYSNNYKIIDNNKNLEWKYITNKFNDLSPDNYIKNILEVNNNILYNKSNIEKDNSAFKVLICEETIVEDINDSSMVVIPIYLNEDLNQGMKLPNLEHLTPYDIYPYIVEVIVLGSSLGDVIQRINSNIILNDY